MKNEKFNIVAKNYKYIGNIITLNLETYLMGLQKNKTIKYEYDKNMPKYHVIIFILC